MSFDLTKTTLYAKATPATTPVAAAGTGGLRYDAATNQWVISVNGGPWLPIGTGSGGGLTVATVGDLTALPSGSFPNGATVTVASVRDFWELDTASTLAVDGITVAATDTGTGRWVRKEVPSEVWAQQPTWFIDPAGGGDDENDGATLGTALATWAEYARRVGDLQCVANQSVTFASDPNEARYVVRGFHQGGLTIQGQETQIQTGTISALVAWDSTTAVVTQGYLEDAGIDFTGLEGSMIRITSGAAQGNISWILKVDPDATGTDRVRTSEWFNAFTFSTTPPAPGDTYELISHTEVTGEWQFDNSRDIGGGSFVYLDSITVNAPPGRFAPIQGTGGSIALGYTRVRSVGNTSVNPFRGGDLETYGTLIHRGRLAIENCEATLFAMAILDGDFDAVRSDVGIAYNCVAQVVPGGDNVGRNVWSIVNGTRANTIGNVAARGHSAGACDLTANGTALLFIGAYSQARRDASGRYWTVDQAANTYGARIEAYGLLSYEPGTTAPAAFDFDVGGLGEEIELGAAGIVTAAGLPAAGQIDAATNAAVIRRALT